ncbi:MAG: PRTRC system protein A [Betaproteobacteria bacterium]|nr:PRTRC system protein A [Betaproteobacteria bacterium]
MDARDMALQRSCPVIAAPRFGELPPMENNGQRIVVASNGVFVQVRLDWLDAIQPISVGSPAMALPFGIVHEKLRFTFGKLPIPLFEAFIEAGRSRLPDEVAGALIYSKRTNTVRLALCESLNASPGSVHYRLPPMDDDETVAVDLHTHGRAHPFWSMTDDLDDMGIKIAGVFGQLHQPQPRAAFRLVINAMRHPLSHPWMPHAEPENIPQPPLEESFLRWILRLWQSKKGG